jgi:hypothetical protein
MRLQVSFSVFTAKTAFVTVFAMAAFWLDLNSKKQSLRLQKLT